jgi:putative ATPase
MASRHRPLADRMRPQKLEEFVGQGHLLAPGAPLRQAIEAGRPHSMVLWGPPGTGKTTLARLMANYCQALFLNLSAVLIGVKEVRMAVDKAQRAQAEGERETVLFIDEVHRFNKSQQDAFLPYLEDGTFIFVGATTENPSFELNNALLSRTRVYTFQGLQVKDIRTVIERALEDTERGLGRRCLVMAEDLRQKLAEAADGDARRALNVLEVASDLADNHRITEELLAKVLGGAIRRFDKRGDIFYDQISALHKAVRGSAPDAALYWFCRLLDGGCDPLYLARRLVRIASEDIGNADPRGLRIALDAWEAYERLGSPEGELAIAQAVLFLSCAPKSNAAYKAFNAAFHASKAYGSLEVPLHLRNAPTKLMRDLGYGQRYRYAHEEPDAYAAGENYFPQEMGQPCYYEPVAQGLEIKIAEKLARLREMDAAYRRQQQQEVNPHSPELPSCQ